MSYAQAFALIYPEFTRRALHGAQAHALAKTENHLSARKYYEALEFFHEHAHTDSFDSQSARPCAD
jgi:hypothetical protein